jgi:hypothetical protein
VEQDRRERIRREQIYEKAKRNFIVPTVEEIIKSIKLVYTVRIPDTIAVNILIDIRNKIYEKQHERNDLISGERQYNINNNTNNNKNIITNNNRRKSDINNVNNEIDLLKIDEIIWDTYSHYLQPNHYQFIFNLIWIFLY